MYQSKVLIKINLGLLCDMLWSDPDKTIDLWGPNDRGVSVTFSSSIIDSFLKKHDMDLICRGHQVNYFLNLRLLRKGTNFLAIENLLQYFQPLIIVANSTMPERWCLLMKIWCAASKFLNQILNLLLNKS